MFEFIPKGTGRSNPVPRELSGEEGRFVIPRKAFVPAYVKTYEEGRLHEKVETALELLRSCHVCPRDCQVNRLENKTGVCKSGRLARVTSAFTAGINREIHESEFAQALAHARAQIDYVGSNFRLQMACQGSSGSLHTAIRA